MNKFFFTVTLLFVCITTYTQTYTQSDWQLVFKDEFNGNELNWEVWQAEQGFVRNEEHQWYQRENARVENGLLVLEGRLDSIPNLMQNIQAQVSIPLAVSHSSMDVWKCVPAYQQSLAHGQQYGR